jgi:hypothetical protein
MLAAGSSYRGMVLQSKCLDFSIFMKIDERRDNNFKGTTLWCVGENEDSELHIEGVIDENHSTISWKETSSIHGSPVLPIPCTFEGKYNVFIGTISGDWSANNQKVTNFG